MGYIEGRGSFSISLQKHHGKTNYYPRPTFILNSSDDDMEVFEDIRAIFSEAGINSYSISHNKVRIGLEVKGLGSIRLEVKGIKNCLRLYEFLKDQEWHTTKRLRFEKWGECLKQIQMKEHLEEDTFPDFVNNVLALNPKTSMARYYSFLEKLK